MADSTGDKKFKLDTAEIPSECDGEIGVRKLTYTDAYGVEQEYHVLACDDIELGVLGGSGGGSGGGGGDGGNLPNMLVVTDIQFEFTEEYGRLRALVSRRNLATGAASPAIRNFDVWKQDVDADSAYSTETKKFTKKVVPGLRTALPGKATTVFEATAHEDEMDG